MCVLPQSHPTTGPVRFYHPYDFLRVVEWSGRRDFMSELFSWSHQATDPVRLDTAVYLWFGWIIRRTPWLPCAVPVRASYVPRTGIYNVFAYATGPVRGQCVTHKGAVRRSCGHARELAQPAMAKIPRERRIWPYGARRGLLRSPRGLSKGCLKS